MPWKRIKFDDMGQNNDADPVLLQYVGGKFVTISPPQAAVAEAHEVWPMNDKGNVRRGAGAGAMTIWPRPLSRVSRAAC